MRKTQKTESQLIYMKKEWITENIKIQVKALGIFTVLYLFGVSNEFLSLLDILEDLIMMMETYNIYKAYKKKKPKLNIAVLR